VASTTARCAELARALEVKVGNKVAVLSNVAR
jgi:hypothetical protein